MEACYIIESVAKQLWQVVPERTKDYIARPKPNGYRSVHLTVHINSIVLGMDGDLVGAQVRTPLWRLRENRGAGKVGVVGCGRVWRMETVR